MEMRALGRTGLQVPTVGMGTWQTFDVHGEAAEQNARSVVDTALEAGANFFDSSPMYGEAERVLGGTLEGRRDVALVATKVWAQSAAEGQAQIERAMRYFGGHIDLYQIHNLVSWRSHLDALERLRDEGRVTAIGATHYQPLAFDELRTVMETGRITAIQIPYNPHEREVEQEILPFAAELELGVVVMRPLGSGDLLRRTPSDIDLEPLLKWILSDPRCHVVIPATSSPRHMAGNAVAGSAPWFGPEEREHVARLVQG